MFINLLGNREAQLPFGDVAFCAVGTHLDQRVHGQNVRSNVVRFDKVIVQSFGMGYRSDFSRTGYHVQRAGQGHHVRFQVGQGPVGTEFLHEIQDALAAIDGVRGRAACPSVDDGIEADGQRLDATGGGPAVIETGGSIRGE
mmetsp:Transcript_1108/g.1139  ORF Transcript_1108/g.1139 Transcript_1108/m.1139 type:complete len:142 (+) Transcript_1108:367-792(+)